MIRVVGANPAMDRVSTWTPIHLGEVNRATSVTVVPGGKGLNVARAVVRLGSQATAYGFLGGEVGEALRRMILADGVVDRHTHVSAGTRVCFIVVEPGMERSTVLNEPGPTVSQEEAARFEDTLREDCRAEDLVIVSGSLPDSVDAGVAAHIVRLAREAGARTILDIHGAPLRAAAVERPWMIKCNQHELRALMADGPAPCVDAGRPGGRPWADLLAGMIELRQRGIEVVVVTLGAEGALLADGSGVLHVTVPMVRAVNATGSGDLLLAGLAVGLERDLPPREAIVLGAACGTAGATCLTPELPPDFDAAEWTPRIRLEVVTPVA